MADAKVRGITIELDGDTTGLSESLKEVNQEISSTTKQLKDVERLLKLDPGNTELLAQKQRLLNQAISESEKKVKTLKAAQEELGERTDKNAEQWDAIQREIIACTNEQKKWRAELERVPGTMEQIEDSAKRISKVTGDLAQKTAGISKVAGGVLAGAVGLAFKAGQSADELNTLSKQYGIATDTIQRFNYAQELVDVSTDTMLASMTKLTKQVGAGSSAFTELGVEIKDANGEYRKTEDIWYDTLEALSKVENETERDILAMELFGKSAKDLAGIIDDGGAALKAFGEEAEEAGLILGQDALDSANEFNDAIDKLKGTASQAFFEAGATLANTLLPHLEKLAEVVQKALEWFGSMDAETQNFILTLVAMVAALSPALSIVSKLSGMMGGLSKAVTFLGSPLGTAILLFGAMVAAGVLLYKNWDTIKEKAGELKEKVVKVFNDIADTIKELPAKALQWGKDMINGFVDGIKSGWSSLKETVSGLAGTVSDYLHFSHPEVGPLADFDTWMPDMMRQLAEGITDNNWRVQEAVTGVAGTIAQGYSPDYSPITGRLDSLIGAAAASGGGGSSNVTVVLQGDAAGVFKLVRTENNKYIRSTGRSAFE